MVLFYQNIKKEFISQVEKHSREATLIHCMKENAGADILYQEHFIANPLK